MFVVPLSISHPESWTEFTRQNISSAVRERLTSIDLRGLIDKVIQDTADDLRDQCAAVDRALAKRCEEMNTAKVKMEQHLDSVGALSYLTTTKGIFLGGQGILLDQLAVLKLPVKKGLCILTLLYIS